MIVGNGGGGTGGGRVWVGGAAWVGGFGGPGVLNLKIFWKYNYKIKLK